MTEKKVHTHKPANSIHTCLFTASFVWRGGLLDGVREPRVRTVLCCLILTWQMVWSACRLPVGWLRRQQVSSESRFLALLGGLQVSCCSSDLTEERNEVLLSWQVFLSVGGCTTSSLPTAGIQKSECLEVGVVRTAMPVDLKLQFEASILVYSHILKYKYTYTPIV